MPTPASSAATTRCVACHRTTGPFTLVRSGNDSFNLCNDPCLGMHTAECNICHLRALDGEIVPEPTPMCIRCRDQRTVTCTVCQTRFLIPENALGDARTVCPTCLPTRAECSLCHTIIFGNNVIRSDAGDDDDEDREIILCRRCNDRPRPLPDTTFLENTSRRKVGFELEFLAPRTPNVAGLGRIKGDGSVGSAPEDAEIMKADKLTQRGGAMEFASVPAAGDTLFVLINRVGRAMRSAGAYANRTCGFHVHLDMSNTNEIQRGRIVTWWYRYEDIFRCMVSPSRRSSSYCRAGRADGDRYRALNLTALNKHGTYECRLHQGTINSTKVKHWILLLLRFMDHYQDVPTTGTNGALTGTPRQKLDRLFKDLDLPLTTRVYLLKRIKKFAKLNPIIEWSKFQS